MNGRLQNKIALVTGAANGIGAATARLFAAEGAKVVLADIDEAAGADLARQLGMHFITADVSCEAHVERAVQSTVERHGRIDCMVNGAGIVGAVGSLMETTAQAWRATQGVLLDSVFFGIKHAARAMREQRSGVILSVSGIAGVMGGLGPHAYTASRHGVIGLTRSAASELSQYGIRVNAVAPGSGMPEEEIAASLLFLASDAAPHVTAHTLVVDSGHTAGGFASGASVLRDRPVAFMGPSGQRTMRVVGERP